MNIGQTARKIRREIIEMAYLSKAPHVGSALSCADILAVAYFQVMKLEPWEERDIFILSKAHAAMALYATLALRGILDPKDLLGYYQNDGKLPGHLDRMMTRGVEVSAGSLGHGFNMGLGMAMGFKKKKSGRRVFALIGDGESQEGSIWEGALFASRLSLDRFTAILDYNNLQGYGRTDGICCFEPLRSKWESFGWEVAEIDGHDYAALQGELKKVSDRPRMVISKTIKGKGVSFMENQLIWHYYVVTDEHRKRALKELA